MKPPASCLNEGFVIKGHFTANSWMYLVLVYLDVESSHCSPLVILEITGSQCSEIFWNYEDTTSVDKCWFAIIRKETAEDSRTKYSERTKKKKGTAKMWSPTQRKSWNEKFFPKFPKLIHGVTDGKRDVPSSSCCPDSFFNVIQECTGKKTSEQNNSILILSLLVCVTADRCLNKSSFSFVALLQLQCNCIKKS